MDDIVTRLRATERAIWDGDDAEERRAFIKMVADEIERLRAEVEFWRTTAQQAMDNTDKALAVIELHKALKNELEKAIPHD